MTDRDGKCISKEKIRHNLCAGSCGNSRTDVLLQGPYDDNFLVTQCKCCRAVMDTDIYVDVDVVCTNSDGSRYDSVAKYVPVEGCECNTCSNGERWFCFLLFFGVGRVLYLSA